MADLSREKKSKNVSTKASPSGVSGFLEAQSADMRKGMHVVKSYINTRFKSADTLMDEVRNATPSVPLGPTQKYKEDPDVLAKNILKMQALEKNTLMTGIGMKYMRKLNRDKGNY